MRGINMKRTIALVLNAACVFSAAFSQTPGKPQKPQQEPEDVLRITTALVQTDVVVTDKNDQIVPDLKLEDFVLFENGKKQDLQFMEFVSIDLLRSREGEIVLAKTLPGVDTSVPRDLTIKDVRRVIAFVVDD